MKDGIRLTEIVESYGNSYAPLQRLPTKKKRKIMELKNCSITSQLSAVFCLLKHKLPIVLYNRCVSATMWLT